MAFDSKQDRSDATDLSLGVEQDEQKQRSRAERLADLRSRVRSISNRVISTVLPGTCLVCEQMVAQQGGCCPSCWSSMRFVAEPMCPVMGTPFSTDIGEGMLSAEAIADPPPFSRLRTVVLYDAVARKLVSGLKFSDRTNHARWMAKWMSVAGRKELAECDLIAPVPLHSRRLIARRYNQSAELARSIALQSEMRRKYKAAILTRIKSTRQQVGLSMNERARNVAGAFQVPVPRKPELSGKRVLLVDDVYTTGATMKAAARALKRAGAAEVMGLVFAKVETRDL